MTAWRTTAAGGPAPVGFLNSQQGHEPWRAASLLDTPGACAALDHATAAAERGVLDPGLPVQAVMSCVVHSNRHRATIADIPLVTMPLATTGQLASPAERSALTTMTRYAGVIGANLAQQTVRVSGRSAAQVAPRMALSDLDRARADAVATSAHDAD